MVRILLPAAVAAATLFGWSQQARATGTAQAAIASRTYLVGSWSCKFTVGREGGNYTTTWTTALNGLWLKQDYDQPLQLRAAAFRAEYFVGYDELHASWVRFGAMSTGQYFVIRMTDTGNGWGWKYVGLFPRKRPPSPGYDATFTRKTDRLYTIDGPTYPDKSGDMVTEHHACQKKT
jgi:hypothetical protein